ncbi:MAG: NAD-dependent epimerase/dehydratase family protein [Oceanospirillales bacterium]|nr:NAD-dependent epimerase/dehydratase family protein [Oceanospirillales bacterium]
MLTEQRLLVLGANSFAGSCLVKAALDAGMEVVGISRSAEKSDAFHPYRQTARAGHYRFYPLDLNRDWPAIADLIRQYQPQYVVDLAGQGMVAESWQQPEQWYQTNVVSKARLLSLLKDLSGLRKYVRVSTPEVYGSTDSLIEEDQPYNPSTPYAVSHAAIDMHLQAYFRQYGFPVVLTRFSNFYGPGQQLYRIIPRTLIYARMGRKLPLHGGGKAIRAFIYGDDVASALLAAMERGVPGQVYHFSTDSFVSIRELVERILALQDIPFASAVEITEDRPGKDLRYLMSDRKAREELGWSDQISLDQGLKNTLDWVNNYWDELIRLPLDYQHKP